MAASAENGIYTGAEQEAKELVEELYKFNRRYLKDHDISLAGKKDEEVKKKMEDTLSRLAKLEDLPRPLYQYLRGKALNIAPTHSKEAEQLLSQAVKQNPTLVDAWNCLGESYWKAGNVQQAHHCFTGALSHEVNKESLRNLSMVLRQIGKDLSDKQDKVRESVDIAKQAVALDVKDGSSWMVLGNAYLALYFTTEQDPTYLQQCASAYSQAEKDPLILVNPDLHFNKATLLLYEEQYNKALVHLDQAALLDPQWPTPQQKTRTIKNFVKTFDELIKTRGKLKPKKLVAMQDSMASPQQWLGDKMASKKQITVKEVGGCSDDREDAVLVGAVCACFTTEDKVPLACVLVDKDGDSIGVTVYNLLSSFVFKTGDVLSIPLSQATIMNIQSLNVSYTSIKVTEPQHLLCNGEPLTRDKLSTSVAQVTAFS